MKEYSEQIEEHLQRSWGRKESDKLKEQKKVVWQESHKLGWLECPCKRQRHGVEIGVYFTSNKPQMTLFHWVTSLWLL